MNDPRLDIRHFTLDDAPALLAYKQRNRQFFAPFEPVREEAHFTLEQTTAELTADEQHRMSGQASIFGVFRTGTQQLVGRIALTGISRGAFQNAYLGYSIDEAHNGKGFATSAVAFCVRHAFTELGLHRIQAGVMPRNTASLRVLAKAGFREEGLAKRYLRIHGRWEDHVLLAVTQEDLPS